VLHLVVDVDGDRSDRLAQVVFAGQRANHRCQIEDHALVVGISGWTRTRQAGSG
jgi:hypothetical protein